VGSSPSGHAGRLTIARMGCARAIVGSARPASAQRAARRNSVVGHAEDRRAGGARGAVMVRAFSAIGSAPGTAGTNRTPTTGCGAVLVAAGRISRFADFPRAACGRPARAGNRGSATAATGGAPSNPATMGAARGRGATTTTATASAGSGSRCRRDDPRPRRGRSRRRCARRDHTHARVAASPGDNAAKRCRDTRPGRPHPADARGRRRRTAGRAHDRVRP
jgi:hypothetical protein